MVEAKRTLVKSGPELWAEVSDPGALARHLAPFGDVRIVRAEPERLVEWAGVRAAGTVALTESGFGTRVELRARILDGVAAPEPVPVPVPVPELEAEADMPPEPAPAGGRRPGFWTRLLRRRRPVAYESPEPPEARPEPPAPVAAAPPPAPAAAAAPAMADDAAQLVLTDTLDALGRAHHRPFSRA